MEADSSSFRERCEQEARRESMQITGTIRPTADSKDFNREAWCSFILSRPEFQLQSPREVPNPFKPGTTMKTPVHRDAADVVVDGRTVGRVHWSMSEEPLVVVKIDPSAVAIAVQWAEEFGGKFQEESW